MKIVENIQFDVTALLKSSGYYSITDTDEDVFKFLDKIENREHCILIFHTEEIRDKIISKFFETKHTHKIITARFTHDPSKFKCDKIMKYDELIENQRLISSKINEFLLDVIVESHDKAHRKIVCDDTAWFSELGLFKEHQGVTIPKNVLNESTIMCCYNITKLNEPELKIVLRSREYIILEKPFSVYKKMSN